MLKRHDRSEKLKARKLNDETVVKCSLHGIILQNKIEVCEAIETRVAACSKRVYNASLALNLMVREWFNGQDDIANVEIPMLWNQTFLRQLLLGVEDARIDIPAVSSFLEQHPEFVLDQERHLGDRNIYTAAAKTILTNLKNHLVLNFAKVLKKYIYNNLVKQEAIEALYQFHGWKRKPPKQTKTKKQANVSKIEEETEKIRKLEAEQRINDLVNNLKRSIGLEDEKVNKMWFKKDASLGKMLKLFVFVNRYLESHNLPNFNILPIVGIKPRFITIDTNTLYGIMKDARLVSCDNEGEFVEHGSLHWSTFINYPKVQGHGKTFTGTIETDSVAVCIHFSRPKSVAPVASTMNLTGKRVLGVDPGRSNILFVAEETAPSKFKHYRLTRKQYYTEAGIFKARDQAQSWHNHNIKEELASLANVSSKSASLEKFQAYLQVVFSTRDALWNEYSKKRWLQQRLRLYGGKKRVFSNFLNKIDGENTVLAFGSAKFAPGGKNEVSVPTSRAYKECSYRFPIVPVDEFRTTRINWKDDSPLQKVAKVNSKGKQVTVRGLLWCGSTNSKNKFVDRDLNAAINIRRCALLPQRPLIMRRGGVELGKPSIGRVL